MTPAAPLMLRFGSLHGRLACPRQEYADALALVFGVGLHPLTPERDATREFDLVIAGAVDPARRPSAGEVPDNALLIGGSRRQPVITTDALHAELMLDQRPVDIRIDVLRDDLSFPALCVHFGVVIHKILFCLDRLMLHAAAVRIGDGVCLFVGDKGAGKSTTTLALARAGATVLGEDQVVLWRSDGGYLVSGGDERSRVTERTERHFFAAPLAVAARDFAGTMKKEIAMRDFFRSEPFRDFPPTRLLFPRVTGRFELRPLAAQAALRRMIGYNGHFQRFAGGRDQAEFLDFLAGFVGSVSTWELSLSEHLADLDRLAEELATA